MLPLLIVRAFERIMKIAVGEYCPSTMSIFIRSSLSGLIVEGAILLAVRLLVTGPLFYDGSRLRESKDRNIFRSFLFFRDSEQFLEI